MKFTINSTVMLQSIGPALEVACNQKSGMKDFESFGKVHLVLDKNKEELKVNAFNGKIFLSGTLSNILTNDLNLSSDKDGQVTVDAKHLSNALSSFNDGQSVEIELKESENSKELFIKDNTDDSQYQTIVCYESNIKSPTEPKEYARSFKINKDIFTSGCKKVSFAFGVQEERPQFFFWALRYRKNLLRFVSGMGGMFAIYNIEGDNIVETKEKEFNVYFYNDYMPVLSKILNNVSDSMVEVKETGKNEAYQIVVSTNSYKVVMIGVNPDVQWPDEQTLLDRKNDFKFVTSIKDWEYAYRGAAATYTDEMKKQEQTHKVSLNADISKKLLEMKSEQVLKFSRKIKIIDMEYPKDTTSHHCSTYSKYIQHVPYCWSSDGNVQIEFSSDANNKVIYAYYNAGEKVVDSKSLKSTNAATGHQESMAFVFARVSVSN